MSNNKISFLPFFLSISLLLLVGCGGETTIQTGEGSVTMDADELVNLVAEAYAYGYPLVIMDMTKNVSTNIEQPHPVRARAPINQLGHYRKFPDHTMKTVVKPNVDTYYTIAWLDLADEPQVLYMPATDRYYLLPFYDAYTNVFASPGTRTTGTEEQEFIIVGPNWKGEIPEGLEPIQAPTEMVWMIARIQTNSVEDGETTVRDIQDGMGLMPLSEYGNDEYVHPKGNVTEEHQDIIPSKAIRALDINTYLNQVAQLMVTNPPATADSTILKKLSKIGFTAGKPFELSTDNLIVKTKLNALPEFIHKKIEEKRDNPDINLMTNGWRVIREGLGTYGTEYMKRAYIGFVGLGANWAEDAVYPTCVFDINGNPLEASNAYQLHFEPNELPPVNAFWSITAYNEDEFLVENELNRFALGDRDPIQYNEDGSLDFYIQTNPPEEEQLSNWLPIPEAGRFTLTMRLYWPKEEVLNGEWNPPFLIPVEE